MNTIQPIAVNQFITEHNRSIENKRDISKWFLNETLVVDFGDSVGRPSSLITLQKEYLTRFLENGWTIDSVMKTSESGRWTTYKNVGSETFSSESGSARGSRFSNGNSEGETTEKSDVDYSADNKSKNDSSTETDDSRKSNSESTTTSNSDSTNDTKNTSVSVTTNSSTSQSSSTSGTSSKSESSSTTSSQRSTSEGTSNNKQTSKNDTSSNSNSVDTSHGTNKNVSTGNSTSKTKQASQGTTKRSENTSDSSSSNENSSNSGYELESGIESSDGDAYWAAVQRVRLTRRRMQPELVLQDMIDSYVVQFNDGVRNEDSRFNELVTLYGVMLNRTETEANNIVYQSLDVTGLFDRLSSSITLTWEQAHNAAMKLWREGTEGNVSEIRYKFEAMISSTRSKMVAQGTYNGTVWPTVEAGIRRQMESAIAEAKTNGMKTAQESIDKVLQIKGDVMAQLVNAKNGIAAAIDQRKITATELRNTVLQAMLNFIGSREDAFPQIQEISQLASQIGFTVGAAGNVL